MNETNPVGSTGIEGANLTRTELDGEYWAMGTVVEPSAVVELIGLDLRKIELAGTYDILTLDGCQGPADFSSVVADKVYIKRCVLDFTDFSGLSCRSLWMYDCSLRFCAISPQCEKITATLCDLRFSTTLYELVPVFWAIRCRIGNEDDDARLPQLVSLIDG